MHLSVLRLVSTYPGWFVHFKFAHYSTYKINRYRFYNNETDGFVETRQRLQRVVFSGGTLDEKVCLPTGGQGFAVSNITLHVNPGSESKGVRLRPETIPPRNKYSKTALLGHTTNILQLLKSFCRRVVSLLRYTSHSASKVWQTPARRHVLWMNIVSSSRYDTPFGVLMRI